MDKENKVVSSGVDMHKAKRMWIHCNCCFVHYVDRENIIFLMSCNHIVCNKCVTVTMRRTPVDAATYTCPICKKLVRARQVNNMLPSNVKQLLHPEPWNDGLPHKTIDRFQRTHHKSLDQQIMRKEREVIKLDKDLELAKKIVSKQYLDHQQLRMERKQLEFQVQKVQRQAQLRKQEAKQRLVCLPFSIVMLIIRFFFSMIRKRSISPNAKLTASGGTTTNSVEIKIRKRPASVQPQMQASPPSVGITSFLHYNNQSFDL
ncbi:hypothetical protein KR093_003544 [Drosophila rubida]|uniref:RING-type domain-containing protein n=1 Tax=Drosophila rubida TaxID=30044 RepID=A0AAD4PQK6_9MUSC|nr:hypothetical protein KR093_003544 [Drosophila rubida]